MSMLYHIYVIVLLYDVYVILYIIYDWFMIKYDISRDLFWNSEYFSESFPNSG